MWHAFLTHFQAGTYWMRVSQKPPPQQLVNLRRGGPTDLPKVNDVIYCKAGVSLGLGKPVCVSPFGKLDFLPWGHFSSFGDILLQRISGAVQFPAEMRLEKFAAWGQNCYLWHNIKVAKQWLRLHQKGPVLSRPKIYIFKWAVSWILPVIWDSDLHFWEEKGFSDVAVILQG